MDAENIPTGMHPKLITTEGTRTVFWPGHMRFPDSALYLICCYLAYRGANLRAVPGVGTFRTTTERHEIAPYAFSSDGRPFEDYRSPFLLGAAIEVPHWYANKCGRYALDGFTIVNLDHWARKPVLKDVAAALNYFDIASQWGDVDEIRSAWERFVQASDEYNAQQEALANFEYLHSAGVEHECETNVTDDEDEYESCDQDETDSEVTDHDTEEEFEQTVLPDSSSLVTERGAGNRGKKRAAPADQTPTEYRLNRIPSCSTCTREMLLHTDDIVIEREVFVIHD